MAKKRKEVLPRQVPLVRIGRVEYALLPASTLRAIAVKRTCKLLVRGPTEGDLVDALDRYFRCLASSLPK